MLAIVIMAIVGPMIFIGLVVFGMCFIYPRWSRQKGIQATQNNQSLIGKRVLSDCGDWGYCEMEILDTEGNKTKVRESDGSVHWIHSGWVKPIKILE